jgi:hypothetical protein
MKRGVGKGYQKDNGRGASCFEPNLLKDRSNTQTWNFETFGHLISYFHYLEFTQFLPSSNCAHFSQCDCERAALMTGSESTAKYGHLMKES